jgi:hypothetical protein
MNMEHSDALPKGQRAEQNDLLSLIEYYSLPGSCHIMEISLFLKNMTHSYGPVFTKRTAFR